MFLEFAVSTNLTLIRN